MNEDNVFFTPLEHVPKQAKVFFYFWPRSNMTYNLFPVA